MAGLWPAMPISACARRNKLMGFNWQRSHGSFPLGADVCSAASLRSVDWNVALHAGVPNSYSVVTCTGVRRSAD
eukprot:358247-Chlamydomonas_euryale.AAC.5